MLPHLLKSLVVAYNTAAAAVGYPLRLPHRLNTNCVHEEQHSQTQQFDAAAPAAADSSVVRRSSVGTLHPRKAQAAEPLRAQLQSHQALADNQQAKTAAGNKMCKTNVWLLGQPQRD